MFVWEQRFELGIRKIDEQHRQLVEMINDLYHAMTENRGQEALRGIVGRMTDYAATHFATEEDYFTRYGYGLRGLHVLEHERFTVKALELKRRLEEHGFVLSLEVIRFLREWLTEHILVSDKQYAAFLLERGVS